MDSGRRRDTWEAILAAAARPKGFKLFKAALALHIDALRRNGGIDGGAGNYGVAAVSLRDRAERLTGNIDIEVPSRNHIVGEPARHCPSR